MTETTETTTEETTAAEGTPERIEANEAIVAANAGQKAVSITDVKDYFNSNTSAAPVSMTELKPLMEKRPDGTSDMDDLKKALTPGPDGEPTYTY